MANTERYETVVRLNTEQAKKEISELEKKKSRMRFSISLYSFMGTKIGNFHEK